MKYFILSLSPNSFLSTCFSCSLYCHIGKDDPLGILKISHPLCCLYSFPTLSAHPIGKSHLLVKKLFKAITIFPLNFPYKICCCKPGYMCIVYILF